MQTYMDLINTFEPLVNEVINLENKIEEARNDVSTHRHDIMTFCRRELKNLEKAGLIEPKDNNPDHKYAYHIVNTNITIEANDYNGVGIHLYDYNRLDWFACMLEDIKTETNAKGLPILDNLSDSEKEKIEKIIGLVH